MRFLLVLMLGLLAQGALALPAQVVLIRHAEKPDDPDALHLSDKGRERAQALVKFFTQDRRLTKYGPPVALYATQVTRRGHSQRTGETLEPLAKELSLPILMPRESEDFKKVAKEILRNPAYEGKTVVVCWVHEYLPEMAAAFGVQPEPSKWKDSVFDRAYVITFTAKGKIKFDYMPQKLLPGDAKYKPKSTETATAR